VTLQQCRLQISPHGRQSDLGLPRRSVERRMRTAMHDALQRLLDRMDAPYRALVVADMERCPMMFDHLSTNLTNWKRACELGSEPAALIRSSAARAAAGGGARGRQGAPRSGGGLVRPAGAHGAFLAALARNCGPTAIAHVCSPGAHIGAGRDGWWFWGPLLRPAGSSGPASSGGTGSANPRAGLYAAPRAWSAAFGKRRPPRIAFELAEASPTQGWKSSSFTHA